MRFLNLTSFFRISILAFVMLFAAGPLSAQPVDTRSSTTIDRDYNRVGTDRDHDNDWGWIGLFGLLGLAGLLPKNRKGDYDRENRKGDYDRGDTGNRTSNR